jgi:hypothetical protein
VEIDRPDKSSFPLDGNAAGGLLCELFAFDMTAASVTCRTCGTVSQVGELALYGGPMGAIFRCIRCNTAVIRLARTPLGFRLDMRGARLVACQATQAGADRS